MVKGLVIVFSMREKQNYQPLEQEKLGKWCQVNLSIDSVYIYIQNFCCTTNTKYIFKMKKSNCCDGCGFIPFFKRLTLVQPDKALKGVLPTIFWTQKRVVKLIINLQQNYYTFFESKFLMFLLPWQYLDMHLAPKFYSTYCMSANQQIPTSQNYSLGKLFYFNV